MSRSLRFAYWALVAVLHGAPMLDPTSRLFEYFGLPAANLLGVVLTLRAIHPGSELEGLFSWPPVAYFGSITYGFYVLHDPPHLLYARWASKIASGPNAELLTAVIAFLTTFCLSAVSFRYFEMPILRLKRYFGHQEHEVFAA